MLKHQVRLFALILFLLVVAGCSRYIVLSTELGDKDSGTGITYYLPKNLLKVVVTRTAVPKDEVAKTAAAAKQAQARADDAKKKAAEATAVAEQAKKVAESAPPSVAKEAQREADLASAKAKVAADDADKAATASAAAAAKANAAAAAGGAKEFTDDISISVLPLGPDTSRHFVANLNHQKNVDDTLKITTTETGLLQSVDATSTDKTPQIVADVAEIAISVFKIAVGVPVTPSKALRAPPPKNTIRCIVSDNPDEKKPPYPDEKKPPYYDVTVFNGIVSAFTYEQIFDPTEDAALKDINLKLCQLSTLFELEIKPSPKPTTQPAANSSSPATAGTKIVINGLAYRRQIPYTINLLKKVESIPLLVENLKRPPMPPADVNKFSLKSTNVLLPNDAPLSVLPLEAGMFVNTEYKTEFKNGMLTKVDATRPSEAAGFVSIPLNIMKRILALPTELLQLKIDYSSKDANLLKSEKNVIEAQQALQQAREAQQKAASGTPSGSQQPAAPNP